MHKYFLACHTHLWTVHSISFFFSNQNRAKSWRFCLNAIIALKISQVKSFITLKQRLACCLWTYRRATVPWSSCIRWKKMAWSVNTRFPLHYVDILGACALLTWRRNGTRTRYWEKTSWQRQCAALRNVLLKTLRPGSHVDVILTCTTYRHVGLDQVPAFLTMMLWDMGLMLQKLFKNGLILTWPPNSPVRNQLELLCDVLEKVHEGPILQL